MRTAFSMSGFMKKIMQSKERWRFAFYISRSYSNGIAVAGDPPAASHPPVPENFPGTPAETLQDFISKVDALDLPSGIENGLMAKLTAAQKQIPNNKNTPARNQLQAFINDVRTQRGKAVTPAQANDLIATAQRIINAIPGK
jgi:hypothetical protein